MLPQITMLKIYPNPVYSVLNVELSTLFETDLCMTLTDIKGREIMTMVNGRTLQGKNCYSIDVSSLPKGSYFVRTVSGTNAFISKLQIE